MMLVWYKDDGYSGHLEFDIEVDNTWHVSTPVNLTQNLLWRGTVIRVRLDPVQSLVTSGLAQIDYIRLCPAQ